MADYIDRDKLLKEIKAYRRNGYSSYSNDLILDIVTRQPSVDAVEVVRCKDCQHKSYESSFKEFNGYIHCGITGVIVNDEHFCSWGEKE